jgi:beta-galactosidase
MVFYFRPMYKNDSYLQDLSPEDVPDFKNKDKVLEIQKASFIPGYKTMLQFK